jgi:hypothetical protein
MNLTIMKNILKAQDEYINLLIDFKVEMDRDDLSIASICGLLDEIKCFWLKRLKIIEFELEELTENTMCFALFGAIYLDVSEYEHYYFKSFGEIQILNDPLLKMEKLFRIPQKDINFDFSINYFKKVILDTLEVVTTYKGIFLILPIDEIAHAYIAREQEYIDSFFWRFISSAFDSDIKSTKEFSEKYDGYEEIEKGLVGFVRDQIIFTDFSDRKLSLRARIEQHQADQANISSLFLNKSDAQSFLISVYSYIAQVADILYICSILRINPYIRYDIIFNYLTSVMYVFIDDVNLRAMIEKSLICYLFRKKIKINIFKNLTFSDYCHKLKQKSLFNSIIEKIHNLNINIFEDDTAKAVLVIEQEFDIWLKN